MRVGLVLAVALVAACSSGSKPNEPSTAGPATPVEKAGNDPWAVRESGKPGELGNPNKIVIGGNNDRPQMGLFALRAADARRVDAEMKQGLEPAYRLAEQLAVKAWAGDRNFCEDAVRQTIGYFGIDGMMDPKELRRWKVATLADVREQHGKDIYKLHVEMIGERDEAACDQTLAVYVEGLSLAAREQLALRNFGY
jgi:hypothetical protein